MRKILTTALLLALAQNAAALSNQFTYQGSLDDNGAAANGAYDLQVELMSNGSIIDTNTFDDVVVTDGVFDVRLDFDTAIDSGNFELRIAVRPGASAGAYTTLSPNTPLLPVPQAQVAALAGEAVSVSVDSIYSPSVVDGALIGADISDGSIGGVDVNSAEVQRRVSGTCADGSSIRAISATGTVTCQSASTGGVTNIDTGGGISGGPITTTGSLSITPNGITSAMIQDGAVGLADIDVAQVQRRIATGCAAGSSIQSVASDGSVVCEVDDASSGSDWSLSGNAGTDAATQFVGTTDAQPLVLRAGNREALRITPRSAIDNGGNNTANLLGGSASNSIGAGFRGVTVLGGGADILSEGFSPLRTEPNSASGNYSTVLGGISNRAGPAIYSTVVGGDGNSASGESSVTVGGSGNLAAGDSAGVLGGGANNAGGSHAAVIGGFSNAARGAGAVTLGGTGNCAGGQYSFAGGGGASVRAAGGASGSCGASDSGDANGDEGSFVWADASTGTPLVSTGPNQFIVRADGGFLVNTNSATSPGSDDLVIAARSIGGDPDADLRLVTRGNRSALIYVQNTTGTLRINMPNLSSASEPRLKVAGGSGGDATLSHGGTWTNASSRSYKTAFEVVDGRAVLDKLAAMEITRWQYKGSEEGTHMGPMAEDFKAAFNLAGDGKSIATVDADGVALAAIQGLNAKLEQENADLRARLAAIEAALSNTGVLP